MAISLSYVIVTHNRRDSLLRTLALLERNTRLPRHEWEVRVVDNASCDGTAEALRDRPRVEVLRLRRNEGVSARSHAFAHCSGEFVILLDDDSYPIGETATRSIRYLECERRVAAVVGRVLLPDGSLEACALPSVLLSGAVCIRRCVLLELGGFRREFFRKAGEYDYSFRLWQAGYRIERYEDLLYRHDKIATGRDPALAHRMDLRNNLILAERYLPEPWRSEYRRDWRERYTAFAEHDRCHAAVRRATVEAREWAAREAAGGRELLSPEVLETLFEWERQTRDVLAWRRREEISSVLIADYGKNLFATYRACRRAGLRVRGILENHPAFAGMEYRDVPVLPDSAVAAQGPEGIVLSNINPAQVIRRLACLRTRFERPVLSLWSPRTLARAGASLVPSTLG